MRRHGGRRRRRARGRRRGYGHANPAGETLRAAGGRGWYSAFEQRWNLSIDQTRDRIDGVRSDVEDSGGVVELVCEESDLRGVHAPAGDKHGPVIVDAHEARAEGWTGDIASRKNSLGRHTIGKRDIICDAEHQLPVTGYSEGRGENLRWKIRDGHRQNLGHDSLDGAERNNRGAGRIENQEFGGGHHEGQSIGSETHR